MLEELGVHWFLVIALCFIPIKWLNRTARTIVAGYVISIIFILSSLILTAIFGLPGLVVISISCGTLFIALFVTIWHIAPKIKRRYLFAFYGIITTASFLILVSWGLIDSELEVAPTTETAVMKYRPFEEGGNLAKLDEPAKIDFDENYPRPVLDGATALYPYYAAVFEAVYPEEEHKDLAFLKVRNSENAFDAFVGWDKEPWRGGGYIPGLKPDIIFLAGLSDEQIERAANLEMNLTAVPIAKEAFVFIVNRFNSVDNLEDYQLKGIYSGRFTNWKDVGAHNTPIKLYMLTGGNMGSNVALNRFIGDVNADFISGRLEVGAMMGIAMGVADYKNYRSSLGYSYRYYIENMVDNDAIKMLDISGVAPTPENIRNGEYPYVAEFIAVYDAGSENPNVSILIDFILSDQGQELMEKTGYVGIN